MPTANETGAVALDPYRKFLDDHLDIAGVLHGRQAFIGQSTW